MHGPINRHLFSRKFVEFSKALLLRTSTSIYNGFTRSWFTFWARAYGSLILTRQDKGGLEVARKKVENNFLFMSTILQMWMLKAYFNRLSKCWNVKLSCNLKLSIWAKKLRWFHLIITTIARAACTQRWLTTPKNADFCKYFSTQDAASR